MRTSSSLLFASLAGALSVASIVACSSSTSSTSSGCASNPFSCAAGETCAVKDQSGTFACLPSGGGAAGSACQNIVGTAPCGDNLLCFQQTASGGQCTSYCEQTGTAHPCPTGQTCQPAALMGTSSIFYVCAGGAAATDGGTDSSVADAAAD